MIPPNGRVTQGAYRGDVGCRAVQVMTVVSVRQWPNPTWSVEPGPPVVPGIGRRQAGPSSMGTLQPEPTDATLKENTGEGIRWPLVVGVGGTRG